jgi:hypothetical protein
MPLMSVITAVIIVLHSAKVYTFPMSFNYP